MHQFMTSFPALFPKGSIASPEGVAVSRRRFGFSLIELLAAVCIVGIMAFFAIPQVTRMHSDGMRNAVIAKGAALDTAIASLIQIRGRTQAVAIDWPGKTNDQRYDLLRPYLAYSESSISAYMPSGYSAVLPSSLDPLTKVTLMEGATQIYY